MVTSFQKITITAFWGLSLCLPLTHAKANSATVLECSSGALKVGQKSVGTARYFAENCQRHWKEQSIRMDFSYTQNIPEWAFRRAATHFLKKNTKQANTLKQLEPITQLYQPVKPGDLYSLSYSYPTQTLILSLNQKVLGKVQGPQVNDYFNIWLGPAPFSATLKQQLLD